jgi:DNA modification methylase
VIAPDLEALAVPLEALDALEGNPRQGDVDAVARSYAKFGQRKPIVARHRPGGRGEVTAGNTQLAAARVLGWSHIAVVWADDDDTTAKAWALADNRTSDLGTYDEAALAAFLQPVSNDAELLAATGYSEADLVQFMAHRSRSHRVDPDEVPDPPVEPITHAGDLWHLGNHRLVCADSTSEEDLARFLGRAQADMVFTDPPYAIYGSSSGISAEVSDDKMVRPFFKALFLRAASHLKVYGHAYVCCDWRSWASLWEMARGTHLAPKNMIVWDKGGSGMGGMFANTHELLFFASRQPSKSRTMTSSRTTGEREVHAANTWRFDRVPGGDDRLHNAQKPTELIGQAIKLSSDEGQIVLDLFAGSGSTLIAAEEQGRRAALVDIDPKWCDVICRRWQAFSGERPTRDGVAVDFLVPRN